MKLRIIILLTGFLLAWTAGAQSRKTEKADRLFDLFKYQDAIKEYKKLARTDKKDRAYIYQKLGDAYAAVSQPEQAEIWYAKAVEYKDIDPVYYFRYAMTLRQNKKYDDAIDWMRKYKIYSGMSDTRLQEFFKELDIVEKVKKDGFKATLFNIDINSPYTEYGGTYYKDNQIVYTTNNIETGIKKVSSWDNLPFTDLKKAYQEGNHFTENGSLGPNINTDFHESSPTFNSDFTVMYFTRNNLQPGKKRRIRDYNLKIYRSFFENGQWGVPEEVHFDSNDYNCAHPVLSKDNKTLYFVSDMPGSYGKSDIYKVNVNTDWTLGEPENMGRKINTEGTETFPFVDKKGNLFFSSDGHAGLGGLDIFVAFYIDGNFLMLKNLGIPYNSSKDDFAFIMHDNEQEGFISSNRLGGNGFDDIYLFRTNEQFSPLIYFIGYTKDNNGYIVPNARVSLYDADTGKLIAKNISMHNGRVTFLVDPKKNYKVIARKNGYDDGFLLFDTQNLNKPNIKKDIKLLQKQKIKGCVADIDTKKPLDSVEVKVYGHNATVNQKFVIYTDKKGCFDFEIPPQSRNKEVDYEYEFRKALYLPKREMYHNVLGKGDSINWLKPNKEWIYLIKLKLNPIYFDLDKDEIRPDAAKELDKIVELLKKYPDIRLSMESHTDSRNTEEYNLDLSERRAKSTMQYLIDHGIDPARLQAKGFGESRPVNKCVDGVKCTEEEHQMNRRTEFMIIN